ncbi:hypothetical protein B0H19DRAFT_1193914 [Mycena capillaripes]|nr:hypothetical protein B0H19DRAFT_1193914 [Mycena capillaripes]
MLDALMPAALMRGDPAIDLDLATAPVFLPALVTLCAACPVLAPRFPPSASAWVFTAIASAGMPACPSRLSPSSWTTLRAAASWACRCVRTRRWLLTKSFRRTCAQT